MFVMEKYGGIDISSIKVGLWRHKKVMEFGRKTQINWVKLKKDIDEYLITSYAASQKMVY